MNQAPHQPDDPRWLLYWQWVRSSYDTAIRILTGLEAEYRQHQLELNEAKQMVDLNTLKKHEIIGLTTCGAARLQTLLTALRAPIGKFHFY